MEERKQKTHLKGRPCDPGEKRLAVLPPGQASNLLAGFSEVVIPRQRSAVEREQRVSGWMKMHHVTWAHIHFDPVGPTLPRFSELLAIFLGPVQKAHFLMQPSIQSGGLASSISPCNFQIPTQFIMPYREGI